MLLVFLAFQLRDASLERLHDTRVYRAVTRIRLECGRSGYLAQLLKLRPVAFPASMALFECQLDFRRACLGLM